MRASPVRWRRMPTRWFVNICTVLFVTSLVGGAIGGPYLLRWSTRCKREADRCSDQAIYWEGLVPQLEQAASDSTQSAEARPQGAGYHRHHARRYAYLAGQAAKIARLYRAEESLWRWGWGTSESIDYRQEHWRESE